MGWRHLARWGFVAAASMLAGCVAYDRRPIDMRPALARSASGLDGATGHPLTLAELDRLVLRNNPDLRAARGKRGVAAAQLIEAGVLPNPTFGASYPFYISGPMGSDGFGLSIAQDVRAILLRPTRREAAGNAAAEIDASLLWQEWQTVGKARLLYVAIGAGDRMKALVARNRKLLEERYDLTNASINQGNGPLASLSPDLVAVGDIEKVADDLDRQQLTRRHQLAALLGLAPDAPLPLAAPRTAPRLDPARVRRDLAGLADRRPDLVALQYGYRSEDARLRQAILSQFPNLVVGALGGRDTNMVYSAGPQASIDIPIFDRNEGNIAIERATRDELGSEAKARATAAAGEIEAILSEQALLIRQLTALEPRLKTAREISRKTELAYKQGSFDERAYVDVEVALLAREQEKLALEQALAEGQVALSSLLGSGLPQIRIEKEPPPSNPLGLLHVAFP